MAIISAIVGFLIGLFGVGNLAAMLLESTHGASEGSAAMTGFFIFGPIGGIIGALLGAALAFRLSGGSATWAGRLAITAAVVTALGGILLAVVASPDRPASYSHVIEFEIGVPVGVLAGIDLPGPHAMWGAAGADLDDKPISQFFEKRCGQNTCILPGSVAALGPLDRFRIAVELGSRRYRFPLDLPAAVTGPVEWSAWRSQDDARLGWRIVRR